MAGKPMTPFYVGLAVVAIAGGAFIWRSVGGKRQAPLTTETLAPLAAGPRGVTMGSDSAPVEVMEFSDFECPWCGQFANIQMADVRARLLTPGKVKWRFMNYMITGHTKSPYAHLAAACANQQGRFWQIHDLIYQHQDEWVSERNPLTKLGDYAREAGVDMDRYNKCVEDRAAWGRVLADKAMGDSLGVNGTPTFFIGGRQWRGSAAPTVDQLVAVVDSQIAARGAPRGTAQPARR
jgi:protein-disulfide isomerase